MSKKELAFEELFPELGRKCIEFQEWESTSPNRHSRVYRPPRDWTAVDIEEIKKHCLSKQRVHEAFIRLIAETQHSKEIPRDVIHLTISGQRMYLFWKELGL